MTKTFKEALENALEETGISLAKIATDSGVSYQQLSKVKQRPNAKTNVDDARRVANAFGVSLDEFLGDETALIRSQIVAEYMKLTPKERRFLQTLADGVDDPDPEASS